MEFSLIFGLLELPFLFLCVFFATMTAKVMKGGKFGKGMTYLSWGFIVMAVGHLHMQIDHLFQFNLFSSILGQYLGQIVWYIALVLTWTFSFIGFYKIYSAGKGA